MSKGTPTRTIRISDDEWREIETVVRHRNEHVNLPPITMREFVVLACREKIAKMARSRGRHLTVADEFVDLPLPAEQLQPELFSGKTLESGEAFA